MVTDVTDERLILAREIWVTFFKSPASEFYQY